MEEEPLEQVIPMGDGTRIVSTQHAHRDGFAWMVLSHSVHGANLLGAGWEEVWEDAEEASTKVAMGFEAVFLYTSAGQQEG